MKPLNSKKGHRKAPPGSAGVKALLVIDQKPIRKKALSRFKTAQSSFLKNRQELFHHLTVVRPAYNSWMAGIAGGKIETIQGLKDQVAEKADLLERIDELIDEEYLSPRMAYQVANQEFEDEKNEKDPLDLDDEQLDLGFGEDPEEDFNEEAYFEKIVKEFASSWEGGGIPENKRPKGRPQKDSDVIRVQKLENEQKIKNLYRQMVRILHPDTGLESNASARELWSEVVEAYKAKDLETLEMLWISIQLMADPNALSVGISNLNRFSQFLVAQTQKIKKEKMMVARNDPSWKFATQDRKELSRRILSELSTAEKELKDVLREIERHLKRYQGKGEKKKTPSGSFYR
ncbi:MAG: J domain-containing protein [Nitrospirae bacterium]|nr:J domain-containing protein [Nitrospirota bacterium]MBI3606322.1 J domain-containing protein [Nitrospirota bacterium]